jgi:hypothetical protein
LEAPLLPDNSRKKSSSARKSGEGKTSSIDRYFELHKPHSRFGFGPRGKPMHFSVLLNENSLLLAHSSPDTPFLYDIDLNAQVIPKPPSKHVNSFLG